MSPRIAYIPGFPDAQEFIACAFEPQNVECRISKCLPGVGFDIHYSTFFGSLLFSKQFLMRRGRTQAHENGFSSKERPPRHRTYTLRQK
jgi:hypothetical protein